MKDLFFLAPISILSAVGVYLIVNTVLTIIFVKFGGFSDYLAHDIQGGVAALFWYSILGLFFAAISFFSAAGIAKCVKNALKNK